MIIKIFNNLAITSLLVIGLLVHPLYLCKAGNTNSEQVETQLDGREVKFDYENYPKEREIAYEYYKQNYKFDAFHPLDKSNIGIDLQDIDNDGKKEIITYLQNDGYCGSSGCKFHILKQNDNVDSTSNVKYNSIAQGQIYPSIKILETKTSGYNDLLIEDKRGIYIWSCSGAIYKVSKAIKESDWGKGCIDDAFGIKREVLPSLWYMQRGVEIANKYGFVGLYKMDRNALKSTFYIDKTTNKWTGKYGINTQDNFLNNKVVQEVAVREYHKIIWEQYLQDYHQYDSLQVGDIVLSQSGMISAAHLVGYLELKSFVDNKGVVDIQNGNLINSTEYLKRFGGYEVNYGIDDLVQKLKGFKLEYDYDERNYEIEREIAYQAETEYGVDDMQPLKKDEIGIFLYDIDNDGEKEILAYYSSRAYCGSLGCPFSIIKPIKHKTEGKKYKKILELVGINDVWILKSSSFGYSDLLFEGNSGDRIWRFTGAKYDLYK